MLPGQNLIRASFPEIQIKIFPWLFKGLKPKFRLEMLRPAIQQAAIIISPQDNLSQRPISAGKDRLQDTGF